MTRSRRFQGGWLLHRGGGFDRRVILLSINANQGALYNVFTAAGNPADSVDVVVTIATGVILQAGLTSGAGWAAGSTLKIVNNGTIAGPGGAGAQGADATPFSFGGGVAGNGGTAIVTNIPLTIDNTAGFVFGGGGGGGAGESASQANPPGSPAAAAAGGGGGGGRGYNNAAGGAGGVAWPGGTADGSAGGNGSGAGPGAGGANGFYQFTLGGDGGAGGDWGAAGANGQNASGAATFVSGIGIGGAAGAAIQTNGHALTWLGGNNASQVKGAVI